MKRATILPFLFVLLAGSLASAQAPHDPARLFPYEAAIELPDATGLVRLPLTAGVLERCRGDLSDLRIQDASGVGQPYLVESGRVGPAEDSVFAVTPTAVERRVEAGASLVAIYREHLVLTPPPSPPEGRWRLELDAASPRFVRDVVVYELAGETRTEIARGTVFRLPAPVRERRSIELPAIAATSQLEVQIAGEGGYLEPTASLVVTREPRTAPVLTLPLTERARRRDGTRTVIELERPSGLVPDRLRLVTPAGHFDREVRVFDLRPGEPPREVGLGVVFRVREIPGAERVEVELERAIGEALRIEIEDGDSPTLDGLTFEADVRRPALVFSSEGRPVWLRFGGGRAQPARYDLQRLLGTRLGDRILAGTLPEATLGEPADNPRFDDGPALQFAMRAGSAPEAARYREVAALTVADAAEGLSRVRLPASVLAAARSDLRDVRIVGADGAQWPYLRGADAADPIALEVSAAPGPEEGTTRHTLSLPVAWATLERLELSTDAPYVSRDFTLYGIDANGRRVELTAGRLEREPNDVLPIAVAWTARRVERLELLVTDGSDAPLELGTVRGWVTSPTLYLAAPNGEYRVLAGDPEAEAPRYEIEQARELILAVRAVDAEVGEARANPAFTPPAWWAADGAHAWAVWGVLILAILVLGLLTWRVARHGPAETPPAAAAPAEPESPKEEPSPAKSEEPPPPVEF